MSDIYLVLGETPHGKRYWRHGADPDTCMDRADRRRVFGPATLQSDTEDGYATPWEAAEVIAELAGFDLNESDSWPLVPEERS